VHVLYEQVGIVCVFSFLRTLILFLVLLECLDCLNEMGLEDINRFAEIVV